MGRGCYTLFRKKSWEELVSALHEKGIATLEIQGTRVKKYYPSPDLRMMGDIDIIIEKEYIPAAGRILKELGYSTVRQGGYEVYGYKRGVHIEIHSDYFAEDCQYFGIINKPFKSATVNEDLSAAVSDTEFWLYHLLHCLRHYRGKGIGIRRILDLYLLAPEMAKTADTSYIDDLLTENGLSEDIRDLFAVANYWFDGIEPDRNIEEVTDAVKTAGTQGNMNSYLSDKFSAMYREGKHFVKLRYFLSLVFPAKDRICTAYPVCEKYHLPYPIAWLHRAIRIPFKPGRMKMLIKCLRNIHNAKIARK